jgi:hypothetical protein
VGATAPAQDSDARAPPQRGTQPSHPGPNKKRLRAGCRRAGARSREGGGPHGARRTQTPSASPWAGPGARRIRPARIIAPGLVIGPLRRRRVRIVLLYREMFAFELGGRQLSSAGTAAAASRTAAKGPRVHDREHVEQRDPHEPRDRGHAPLPCTAPGRRSVMRRRRAEGLDAGKVRARTRLRTPVSGPCGSCTCMTRSALVAGGGYRSVPAGPHGATRDRPPSA